MRYDITNALVFKLHDEYGLHDIKDENLKEGYSKISWKSNVIHEDSKINYYQKNTAFTIQSKIEEKFEEYSVNPRALAYILSSLESESIFDYIDFKADNIFYDIRKNGEDFTGVHGIGSVRLVVVFNNGFDTPFYIPITFKLIGALVDATMDSMSDIISGGNSFWNFVNINITQYPQLQETEVGDIKIIS